MNDMKKNIRRVFFLFFTMFLVTVVYLSLFILIYSKDIINNTLNPRVRINRTNIQRGQILDAYGMVIAESIQEQEEFVRVYNEERVFSHVVGFVGRGYSGVEEKYNFSLQNLSFEVPQRMKNIIIGSQLKGDDIVLTIDGELQRFVYNTLGNNTGSIVVMEPSTGKILSMVSYPNFNPNEISRDWENLIEATNDSPLLNRATQGVYPPGSIFKIITSAAAMEYLDNFHDFTYNCTGHITIDDNTIRCYNSVAHGVVNMNDAFKVSCNTYFVEVANIIGAENLLNYAEMLYFNESIPFKLESSTSHLTLNEIDNIAELMQISIGQGRTLVTPLHMAMVVSAVANDGVMMQPYVVDYVTTNTPLIRNRTSPQILTQAFSLEQSRELNNMMVEVVEDGTGFAAFINGIQVGGKTGTAENDHGDSHGWFVAFAPANNPEIAVAVVLENSGGASRAVTMTKDIINFALS